MIKYILAVMAISLLMSGGIVVASGGTSGLIQNLHLFDGYIGDQGIDVVLPQGDDAKVVKFNIAQFYKDILKISDSPELLTACRTQTEQSFHDCVEARSTKQQQIKYKRQMRHINDAVQLMKQHGSQLHQVPFVQDLLAEDH